VFVCLCALFYIVFVWFSALLHILLVCIWLFFVVLVCLSGLFPVCYFIVFFISAAVPSGVTCKPPTSDCPKKVKHRNSSKLSSGTVVPLIFGLKSEGVVGSVGIQLQESSEVAGMSGAESAKINSSTSTLVSLNKTYDKIYDKEAVTENKSEVDKVKSGDRNLMAVVTHKAGPTSGTKSLGPLSLFDPDVPPGLSGDGYNKETTTSETVTNRNGADVVPVMDNSDSTSTATRVESPVDISLSIKNIMEEMSIPNPLSPVNSEPETSRSYGQSMYYLTCNYVYIILVV
jgi:hypothetical protein